MSTRPTDEQIALESCIGRTIISAEYDDVGDSLTGHGEVTLTLSDGVELRIQSHGWHDISSLGVEVIRSA